MAGWRTRGDLLRWWRRDVCGYTQQQLAEQVSVEPSTVSHWERDKRTSSLDYETLDRALAGDGALAGLLWGYGTVAGLDAGQVWTKVFPGPSQPVWMWVRATTPSIAVEAEWGVFRLERELDVGPNGVFVTVGASVPDSPVVVYLAAPGWVDFGHGVLPEAIPDADVYAAVSSFTRSSADGAFMELFRAELESEHASDERAGIDGRPLSASIATFVTQGADRSGLARWPLRPDGIDALARAKFARLREARDLSLPQLAARVERRTGVDVGRDTLRRFETDVGEPHDKMLPIALDHVLGADGRLAAVEVKAGRGSGTVTFPHFWRGPVWLSVDPAGTDARVVLGRGRWQREVEVDTPLVVSVHWFDPSVPLRIDAPRFVSWSVGLGRRAGTEAIDQNWVPSSVDIAQQAVADAKAAFTTAFGLDDS